MKNPTRHDAIYVRISKKSEEINCRQDIFSGDIGTVLFEIESVQPEVCRKFRNRISELAQTLHIESAEDITSSAKSMREIASSLGLPDVIAEALLYLPIYNTIDILEKSVDVVLPSAYERAQLLESGLSPSEVFSARTVGIYKADTDSMLWNYWRAILDGETAGQSILANLTSHLSEEYEKSKEYESIVLRHLELLEIQSYEIEKLRSHGSSSFRSTSDDKGFNRIYKDIIDFMPPGMGKWYSDEHCSFDEGGSFSEVYRCVRLTSIVAVELAKIREFKRKIELCESCGKPFVAYSKEARYCHRPSPADRARTCAEFGRYSKHRMKINNDAVLKEAYKLNKTYYNWKMRALKKNPTEEIVDDIENNYSEWYGKLGRTIDKYREGKITTEKALELMTIPSVKERSLLLYTY